jgi:hypothetical protein
VDDPEDPPELEFDDVLRLVEGSRGGYVEVRVSLSPADEDRSALVAAFSGLLDAVRHRESSAPVVEIRLNPDHASFAPKGHVFLNRRTFMRAEEHVDDPLTLLIWQRGIKLSLELYGPPADAPTPAAPAAPRDDTPF